MVSEHHKPGGAKPLDPRRKARRARGARLCISCGTDPLEGDCPSWCPDALPSIGAALRDCRDLQAAIAWQPERDLELNPVLAPPEREQLGRLFDALVRAREQARGETPRKLWTIREWREREGRA